jgi:hypothetical protein
VEPFTRLHSNSRLLSLAANTRLGMRRMAVAHTPAYYNIATITAAKMFIADTQMFTHVTQVKIYLVECFL